MTIKPSELVLTSVYERPDRYWVLFLLLAERDETSNISHKGLPQWDAHCDFVESRPYEHWYFIGTEPLGACYLTKQNEIGVFIFKAHQGQGLGRQAVEAIIEKHGPRRYLANINPHNERSAALFASLGFKLIQHTYERI